MKKIFWNILIFIIYIFELAYIGYMLIEENDNRGSHINYSMPSPEYSNYGPAYQYNSHGRPVAPETLNLPLMFTEEDFNKVDEALKKVGLDGINYPFGDNSEESLGEKIEVGSPSSLELFVAYYTTTHYLGKDGDGVLIRPKGASVSPRNKVNIDWVFEKNINSIQSNVYIRNTVDNENRWKEIQKTEEELTKIINSFETDGTEESKVKAAYNWLVENVKYDYTYSKGGIYNAVVDKSSVCEGYARTFYQLCKRQGIEVDYIHGHSTSQSLDGVGHAWNRAKIDGEWYYFDCTWGAGSNHPELYYKMSKEQCDKDHIEECIHD